MKKINILFFLAITFLLVDCKNPLKNIKLYINANYYHYTVTMSLVDASIPNLHPNAKITIGGPNASSVYDRGGNKKFIVSGGMVDFTVSPAANVQPTASNPLIFYVNISAPGYLPVTKVVTISSTDNNQRYTVRLLSSTPDNNPHDGISVGGRTIGQSAGGGVSTPGYAGTRTTSGTMSDDSLSSYNVGLYLPMGTTFYYYKDADGNPVGTKVSQLTHDSTVVFGDAAISYRPITGYYQEEDTTSHLRTLSKVAYLGSIQVRYLYKDRTLFPPLNYSIYPFGTTANKITIQDLNSVYENNLVFTSAVMQRLIGVYFVGTLSDGSQINISPDASFDWKISYKINPTLHNPNTGMPYAAGDSIETGINYGEGNYPIEIPGISTFTPSLTLKSTKSYVRLTSTGQLRVESQSTDAGYYKQGISQSYSYTYDGSVQTNQADANYIPDPENLTGYAVIKFISGASQDKFTSVINPGDNKTLAGTVTVPLTGGVTPVISAQAYVNYWGGLVKGDSTGVMPSSTYKIFQAGTFSNPAYLHDTMSFYYTFGCDTRIIQPMFNGQMKYINSTGDSSFFNCNIVGGYWKTRGINIGQNITLIGNACDHPKAFPLITAAPYNQKTINDIDICNCYFK